MLVVAGQRLKERGEDEKAAAQWKIALKVIDAFGEDFVEDKWFWATVDVYMGEKRDEVIGLLEG